MLFGVFCGEHQHAIYYVAGPWKKTHCLALFGMWQFWGQTLPRVIWNVACLWTHIDALLNMWQVCEQTARRALPHITWYVAGVWTNINTLFGMSQACGET